MSTPPLPAIDVAALKPCPKCNANSRDGDAELRGSRDGDVEWYRCRRCGYESPCALTAAKAKANWNTPTTSKHTHTLDVAALIERLRSLVAKASIGPWEFDSEFNEDGEYGPGPDPGRGFDDYMILAAEGGKIVGTENATHKSIEEEYSSDEYGTNKDAWDAIGRANAELIVAAVNALPTLLDTLDSLSKGEWRTIDSAPGQVEAALWQYRNDLQYPVSADSLPRRLAMIDAALASLQGGEAEREAMARIIDPIAFKAWQASYDYSIAQGDSTEDATKQADWSQKVACDEALAKADAILALRSGGGK